MAASRQAYRLAAVTLLIGCMLTAARRAPAATAAPQSGEAIFVGAGDIANCTLTQDSATASLLDVITGTVYTLGDNAYEHGTQADFNNCYEPTWGRHKARTKPVPGNHEYHTSGASGYYGYFGAAASPLDTNCVSACKGYYSYDLGSWHIVALNSEIDRSASSPQIAWLKADLAANTSACTLAYWHKPLYSSGVHGNNSSQQPFWDVLYHFGADVVLNGHDHNYERFAPQSPTGVFDPLRGIRQFVVGTGGAGLRSFVTTRPNSEVRNSNTHGVLRFVLSDGGYSWNFVPVAGKTFTDAGSASCVNGTNQGPVGFWRMDPIISGGTRTTNLATGSVDATYRGDAAPGAQPPDNNTGLPNVAHPGARALNKVTASFDGAGDYIEVDVNGVPALSNTMTLAAWVKLSNPSGNQKVVGRMMINDPTERSGFLLSVVGGELQAEVYDAGSAQYLLTGGAIVTDTWTHVAMAWQTGGAMAIYVNGAQAQTRTASALPIGNRSLPGNGDRVVIGGAPWAPAVNSLAGSVDEVMIFDRALPPIDIALIAQRTFIVNSASNSVTTCDGDACTLKTAIEHANAAPNGALTDRIHFDLPAPAVIQPDAALPTITDTVRIDGLTQPGASCVAWPPVVRVALDGSAAPAGTNGLSSDAPMVEIAGLNVRNFAGIGIALSGAASNTRITCSVLGADASGTSAAPNGTFGVHILQGNGSILQRNLISGNGIGIYLANTHGVTIADNRIGTNMTGTAAIPNNGAAIWSHDASNITITRNLIAHNAGAGVWITSSNATGNLLSENAIHDNGGLGIDLEAPGVTPNDPGDSDIDGGNRLQNFPVLGQVRASGSSVIISATLNSTANTQFRIEYFANAATADCEGAQFVGFDSVTTDANGDVAISTTLTAAVASDHNLSATATNLSTRDTSEFSACLPITYKGRVYLPLTRR